MRRDDPQPAAPQADFLAAMAASSARRAQAARVRESAAALLRHAHAVPVAPPLRLSPAGFDLVAEVKRRTPRGRRLAGGRGVASLARAYAAAGAAAVSVLTEPTRFGGALRHLARAAHGLPVPAMRKDFLVDPYPVIEARAAGAGGVLLIARILDDARLADMLGVAKDLGLFVLLEAFDERDLERIAPCATPRGAATTAPVLLGLNARDLATLEIDGTRHERLARSFPAASLRVAESGLDGPADAARAAAAGYTLALAGTALMAADDPTASVAAMLIAGRAAARRSGDACASA